MKQTHKNTKSLQIIQYCPCYLEKAYITTVTTARIGHADNTSGISNHPISFINTSLDKKSKRKMQWAETNNKLITDKFAHNNRQADKSVISTTTTTKSIYINVHINTKITALLTTYILSDGHNDPLSKNLRVKQAKLGVTTLK